MERFETAKGLECCQNYHECSKCPYNTGSADTDECKSECMRDAAEVICGQQTEIERLQHILISFMNEVEVLERKYGADTSNIPAIAVLGTEKENIVKHIRSETIKEFEKRLKSKALTTIRGGQLGVIDCYDIDNLAKEMAGDE